MKSSWAACTQVAAAWGWGPAASVGAWQGAGVSELGAKVQRLPAVPDPQQ